MLSWEKQRDVKPSTIFFISPFTDMTFLKALEYDRFEKPISLPPPHTHTHSLDSIFCIFWLSPDSQPLQQPDSRKSKPNRSHLPKAATFTPTSPKKNPKSFINYTSQQIKIKVTTVYPKHLTGHCFTFVQTETKEMKKKESQLMLKHKQETSPKHWCYKELEKRMYRTLYSLTFWVNYHRCWLVLRECLYRHTKKSSPCFFFSLFSFNKSSYWTKTKQKTSATTSIANVSSVVWRPPRPPSPSPWCFLVQIQQQQVA